MMGPLLLPDALSHFPDFPATMNFALVLLKRGNFFTKEQLRSELSLWLKGKVRLRVLSSGAVLLRGKCPAS